MKAMEVVKYGKMGVNRVAKEYAVPKTTLKTDCLERYNMAENEIQNPTYP